MSVFSSTLSLSSNTNQLDDKAKLLSLIRAWRSKYDQAHTAALRHRDVIDSLKKDVERLTDEKESVSSHLQLTIDKERAENKANLMEIKTKLATVETEKESETKVLKEKVKKLQNDVKPIISVFKGRDIKWQEKTEKLERLVEELKAKLKERDDLIESVETKSKKEKNEIASENENLKERFQENVEKIKNHCTEKIVQLRKSLEGKFAEEKVELLKNSDKTLTAELNLKIEEIEKLNKTISAKDEEMKTATENFDKEKVKIETSAKDKAQKELQVKQNEFDKMKKEIVENADTKVKELEKTKEKEILQLKLGQNAEIRKLKKRIELINMKCRESQKETKRLREFFEEGKSKLQETRKLTRRQHSDVSVILLNVKDLAPVSNERDDVTASPPMTSPSPKLNNLLDELGVRMAEIGDIEKSLDRFDSLNKNNEEGGDEESLRLEIQYYIKINEIAHLKKTIRQEQINFAYRDNSSVASPNITNSNVGSEKTFLFSNNKVTFPGFTVLSSNVRSMTSGDFQKGKATLNTRKRIVKRRSVPSGRNGWLNNQSNVSTVQLDPKLNGREIWH